MAGSSDWDLPEPFHIEVVVEKSDIDGYGHANNTVYLRWLEELVWAHSRAVGLGLEDFRRLGRAMVVHRSELDYLAPAFEGDRLLVANWIVARDRVSARRRFQIRRAGVGETLLRAEILYVCIDLAKGRARRMPPEFLESYGVGERVREALEADGRDTVRPRAPG